jgi:hypothetical protein
MTRRLTARAGALVALSLLPVAVGPSSAIPMVRVRVTRRVGRRRRDFSTVHATDPAGDNCCQKKRRPAVSGDCRSLDPGLSAVCHVGAYVVDAAGRLTR